MDNTFASGLVLLGASQLTLIGLGLTPTVPGSLLLLLLGLLIIQCKREP